MRRTVQENRDLLAPRKPHAFDPDDDGTQPNERGIRHRDRAEYRGGRPYVRPGAYARERSHDPNARNDERTAERCPRVDGSLSGLYGLSRRNVDEGYAKTPEQA